MFLFCHKLHVNLINFPIFISCIDPEKSQGDYLGMFSENQANMDQVHDLARRNWSHFFLLGDLGLFLEVCLLDVIWLNVDFEDIDQ